MPGKRDAEPGARSLRQAVTHFTTAGALVAIAVWRIGRHEVPIGRVRTRLESARMIDAKRFRDAVRSGLPSLVVQLEAAGSQRISRQIVDAG